jgi:hypothetical protein
LLEKVEAMAVILGLEEVMEMAEVGVVKEEAEEEEEKEEVTNRRGIGQNLCWYCLP